MRWSRFVTLVLGLAIVAAVAGASPSRISAATFTDEFNYAATTTGSKDLFDTHLRRIDDNFPGTLWFRIRIGIDTQLQIDQDAETRMNLNTPRQASSVEAYSTLTLNDTAGKELRVKAKPFIDIDAAFDGVGDRCALTYISSDAALDSAQAAGTCLDVAIHTGKIYPNPLGFSIFEKNGLLPYSGSMSLGDNVNGPNLFDIGALVGVPGVLKVNLDFHTIFMASATDGYQALREVRHNQNVLSSATLRWPNGNQITDSFMLPCNAPLGANLTYRLANQRWTGYVTVTTAPRVAISLAGVNLFGWDLASTTLMSGLTTVAGDNLAHGMGAVQPEISRPTVTGGGPYTGAEGSTVTLTADGIGLFGTFDNCDPDGLNLTYAWSFGDGGATVFGKTVNRMFTDSGTRNGTLSVTDEAGNITVVPVTAQIANVAPTATFTADTVTGFGRPTTTLALTNPHDVSSADRQAGFTYSFDCGNGFDAFSTATSRVCNGTSAGTTVRGRIRDKDGGIHGYAATVTPSTTVLTVVSDGGVVTSNPAGISCSLNPSDCTHSYPAGTVVTLTANDFAGGQFDGWTGCDTVQFNVCTVTINGSRTVTAHYEPL
jgi:hypothetical protein